MFLCEKNIINSLKMTLYRASNELRDNEQMHELTALKVYPSAKSYQQLITGIGSWEGSLRVSTQSGGLYNDNVLMLLLHLMA